MLSAREGFPQEEIAADSHCFQGVVGDGGDAETEPRWFREVLFYLNPQMA